MKSTSAGNRPVAGGRRAKARTFQPSVTSRRTTAGPRNPVAPVTATIPEAVTSARRFDQERLKAINNLPTREALRHPCATTSAHELAFLRRHRGKLLHG
jgi:hypothetical protein